MKNVVRYLKNAIHEDALVKSKMAFVSGPRQVGKSTLAQQCMSDPGNYFVYDRDEFRKAWIKSPIDSISKRGAGPVVLDEIHKDRKWKLRLKGIYDTSNHKIPMIITGSARLDIYRKGSDSLLGRYLPYRLHPFSVAENSNPITPEEVFLNKKKQFDWESLMALGGFPEPLLSGREAEAMRWSRLRLDRIVLEDTRDFLNISDLESFKNLALLLPDRVGSLLSVNSLREDIGKAYATIRSWVQVLDTLYFSFTIKPYSKNISRAIRSEPKLYLYDILRIPAVNKPKRLENLTALHLLKLCHYWTDTAQGDFELCFIRNKDGREVDFLVTNNNQPWMLVECKSSSKEPAKDLIFYSHMLKPKWSIQLIHGKKYDRFFAAYGVRVVDYETFFSGLV